MAHSMLTAKKNSNEYWVEAVETALYIWNRCLTKSVKKRVPRESWTGLKHNVAHLKNFGCVAYAHVPDELRRKLDKKGQKFIFVGYSEETKGYNMYDHAARKFIISHDVQFVENEAWDGSIEKTIKIINAMEHDEIEYEVFQTPCTGQCIIVPSTPSTATQNIAQSTPVRTADAQSTPRVQQTPARSPSSSTSRDPNLASMLPRKTRSLCNIYNEDAANSFSVFSLFSQIDDPLTFEEAVKDDVWAQAMDEEIRCIESNQTWKMVDVPDDKDVICFKWIYKTKQDAEGKVQKHKARLVARGFTQQPGIDFNETFAPVARMDTVKTVLAIVAQYKWPVY
jgi:hypothetical protein